MGKEGRRKREDRTVTAVRTEGREEKGGETKGGEYIHRSRCGLRRACFLTLVEEKKTRSGRGIDDCKRWNERVWVDRWRE